LGVLALKYTQCLPQMCNGLGAGHQQSGPSRMLLGHERDDKACEGHEQASAGEPESHVIDRDDIQYFVHCT
jgi:hypothetical protein